MLAIDYHSIEYKTEEWLFFAGSFQNIKDPTLNCLEAKQLCHQDLSCSAILKVIPLLCGPELGNVEF